MGGVNVKNTMIQRLLSAIAPHPCYGCGKVGVLLCDNCKYNITHEPYVGCILCETPQKDGICPNHRSPIEKAFVVSDRSGTLKNIINDLKFSNVKSAATVLAELLDESLPVLPSTTLLVSVPTVRSHVRRRGYDQADLITRHFAHLRGLQVVRPIARMTQTTQHTVGRAERLDQSKEAFALRDGFEAHTEGRYLLIDDIITTGATLSAAAEHLSRAGLPVWVAALAYQPLD